MDRAVYEAVSRLQQDARGRSMPAPRRGGKPTAIEAARAHREVQSAIQRGMFVPASLPRLRCRDCPDEIRRELDGKCQQLILEVSQSCNLRCAYCAYSGHDPNNRGHGPRHMPLATARAAVEFFTHCSRKSDRVAVSFYGGEPLLRTSFVRRVIAYARHVMADRQVTFHLTTNGTRLDAETCAFLVSNEVRILVSLDGPKSAHDRYRVRRGGAGTHTLVMRNLRRLRQQHPSFFDTNVSLSVVLAGPVDFGKLSRFFDQPLLSRITMSLADVHDPEGGFARSHPSSQAPSRGYSRLRARYAECLLRARRANGFLRGLFEKDLATIHQREMTDGFRQPLHPNGICMPGRRRLFVDASGRLHPCERVNPNMPIGSLRTGFDVEKIAAYIRTYREVSSADCSRCWAIRWCTMCFQSALGRELAVENKRKHCDAIRAFWRDRMTLYCEIAERNPKAFQALGGLKRS